MKTASMIKGDKQGGPCPGKVSPCESGVLERPRYFPRQLMTPDELTLEQRYFRDRLRRHNRLLHGWGVVCGALVCRLVNTDGDYHPWCVTLTSGYILGPFGDEIVIACDHTLDLRSLGVSGASGDPCASLPDPWCSEVLVERQPGPLFIAVRYKETMTRPVRVQPVGCGCDDTQCEYSRWQDCYEICILDHCPDSHAGEPPESPDCSGPLRQCPPCPEDPWVVLARVELNENGIACVDNESCRRMVLSLAEYWCRPAAAGAPPAEPQPGEERPPWKEPRPGKERPPREERDREEAERAYRELRASLGEVADLTRAGFPSAEEVGDMRRWPGSRLKGVTAGSSLGKKINQENLDVHAVADMSEDDFVKLALEGETERLGPKEKQAREVWSNARRTLELIDEWER